MTKLKREYLKYLESSHWKQLRRVVLDRDNFTCSHCGSHHLLRVHHKRYRKDLRACRPDDLITLCVKCHKKEHKRLRKLRKEHRKLKIRQTQRPDHISNLLPRYSATDP